MGELQIEAIVPQEKGRAALHFENGMEVTLYKGEIRKFSLAEGACISGEQYQAILQETVGIRAKKRAMHLLEKMDRTEQQLYDKLKQNGYPDSCIEEAIAYVKRYGYVDDLRYARQYIRYHQSKKSRQRLMMDLMQKGVAKQLILQALEEEFDTDERKKIKELLERRHYKETGSDRKEQQRTFQFLMRRGFRSVDILSVMKYTGTFDE